MTNRGSRLPLEFRDADMGPHRRDRVVLSMCVPGGLVTALQAPVSVGERLCRAARGRQLPEAGTVAVFGRDTRTFGAKELKSLEHRVIAVVAALPQLHEDLSLLDNSTLTARLIGVRPGPVVETARELFGEAGLLQQMTLKPPIAGTHALRMTALIRAILPRPSLVIVEPEAIDTDVQFAERCCHVLREFAAETGAGVFWSTYSTRLACTADRAWTYSMGRAVDLDA